MAKKKQSPREKREMEKQKNAQRWRAAADAKEEAKKAAAVKAERERLQKELDAHWAQDRKDSQGAKSKKTRAKAAGLKSVFNLPDNRLLMTSFQNGNAARVEYRIVDRNAEALASPQVFQVGMEGSDVRKNQFLIQGRNFIDALRDDPRPVMDDLIGCKSALEEQFFGQTFEDNIHIQLIYNILDVEKTLAVYINSIIYELNNILHREEPDWEENELEHLVQDDVLATKKTDVYKALIRKPQLLYYSSVFFEKDEKGKFKRKSDDEIFAILKLLVSVRLSVGHYMKKSPQNTFIYCLDELGQKEKDKPLVEILDRFYDTRVEELNRNFDKLAKTDLTILFRALGAKEHHAKAELAQMYYDFVVRKTQKNLGFSVKQLREIFLTFTDAVDENRKQLTDTAYDTVRHKLYKAIDFVVNRYYLTHPEQVDAMVSRLRAEPPSRKIELYEKEARALWKSIRNDVLYGIVPQVQDIKNVIKNPDPETSGLVANMIVPDHTSRFSKLMYLMTMFLDGKEINDLLSTLLSKFQNIDSFLYVLDELQKLENHEVAAFKPYYRMFCQSGRIAQELNEIRSFARMQKPDANAKRIMFVEAAQILGSDKGAEELIEYFDGILSKPQPGMKKDNGFRNFIINNVIQSSRFQYLIRYTGPIQARRMADNETVMSFVLQELPDDQIHRYYESCREDWEELILPENSSERRAALAKKITGLRFSDFEHVRQDDKGSDEEKADKQRKRAIIGLYLTVLYLLTKNLVYVNARYFMAFHSYERDNTLKFSKEKNLSYLQFSEKALETARMKKRAKEYIRQNLQNANLIGNDSINKYRNQVAHLNAIRMADRYLGDIREIESYYALYHYIMQRMLMDLDKAGKIERNPDSDLLKKYFEKVRHYRTYCKDMVKALNVPFSYNLPRYKNLSIDGLFDRNRPGSGKKTIAPDGGNE